MIQEKLVSVIIPIYNVEKYLDQCIQSVVDQSHRCIEIILVDDGSTDNSPGICDAWGKKDDRIKVIHKSNDGLNMARYTGWQESSGEYITFLDSDDIFTPNNIERSLECMLSNDVDIVVYGFHQFSDSDHINLGHQITGDGRHAARRLDSVNEIAAYALFGEQNLPNIHYMTVWGKLYARKAVECVDWRISNYRVYEDNFWTPQALLAVNAIGIISDKLIFYRRNAQYGSVDGRVLSTKVTGNSWNGVPIGYIELIDRLDGFCKDIIKRHNINDIEPKINDMIFSNKIVRLEVLIHNDLLGEENNLAYVKSIWAEYKLRNEQLIEVLKSVKERPSQPRDIKKMVDMLARRFTRKTKEDN